MKDAQGQMRGACTEPGCGCLDYSKPSDSHKCDFCGHYPTQHKAVGTAINTSQSTQAAKQPEPSRAQAAPTSSPSTANRSASFSSSTNTSNANSNPPAKTTATKSLSLSSPSSPPTKKADLESDEDDEVQFAPRDPSIPATAVSSKPVKKKSILDDLKNPKKLIKEKTKKHKD